jgi:hypothetical protein
MDSMIFNQSNLIKDAQLNKQEPVNIPIMESLPMPKKKEKVDKYQNVNKSFGTLEEIAMTRLLPYDSRFTGIPE